MMEVVDASAVSLARSAESFADRWYPESRFGGFTAVDGTVAFYARVNALLVPSAVVVDFGCGRGRAAEDTLPLRRELQRLRGKVARVIGLDVDTVGGQNPGIDEFRLLDPAAPWPVDTGAVDLVLMDNVMEHLPDPDAFFREARRVLVPGGYLCARTPNRFGYVSLMASLMPERLHDRLLSRAQPSREQRDVFPAVYRCNTVRTWRKAFCHYGFEGLATAHESEPRYLEFSRLAFAAGVLYQKIAPTVLRNVIFAFAQKAR